MSDYAWQDYDAYDYNTFMTDMLTGNFQSIYDEWMANEGELLENPLSYPEFQLSSSIQPTGYEDFFPSRTDFLSHLGNIEDNANMLADANRLSILSQRPDSVITGRKGHYSDISENPFNLSQQVQDRFDYDQEQYLGEQTGATLTHFSDFWSGMQQAQDMGLFQHGDYYDHPDLSWETVWHPQNDSWGAGHAPGPEWSSEQLDLQNQIIQSFQTQVADAIQHGNYENMSEDFASETFEMFMDYFSNNYIDAATAYQMSDEDLASHFEGLGFDPAWSDWLLSVGGNLEQAYDIEHQDGALQSYISPDMISDIALSFMPGGTGFVMDGPNIPAYQQYADLMGWDPQEMFGWHDWSGGDWSPGS